MIDIYKLRKETEEVAIRLANRGFILDIELFSKLENERKNIQTQLETKKAQMNHSSALVGKYKQQGLDVTIHLKDLSLLSDEIKTLEHSFQANHKKLDDFLSQIPNIPDETVPVGKDENDNIEIMRHGKIPEFNFIVKDHTELCPNTMSFEQGAAISGSRFVVLHGCLSRLNRAIAQWMLDTHVSRGYHEVNVPYLVNQESMFGTSQLPKFKDEQYHILGDDLFLIPTAEVPVTNIFKSSQILESQLPLKYVAYSACFRREAGSYGRDTKGLIRQHQFEKVELVQWVKSEDGILAHENITQDAEYILKCLNLPYRKMLLCTGDMGFASCKTYDLEVWIPSQNCYREISSSSLFTDFQSRRMKTKIKYNTGKSDYIYTLNASGLAVGRTLVAILENFQNLNGDIIIPEVLRPYMQNKEIIKHDEL